MSEKVERCRREVETGRERYEQSLTELNGYNAKYIEDMTEVFQRTQDFEHRRLTFIKKILYDMLACVDLTQYKASVAHHSSLHTTKRFLPSNQSTQRNARNERNKRSERTAKTQG